MASIDTSYEENLVSRLSSLSAEIAKGAAELHAVRTEAAREKNIAKRAFAIKEQVCTSMEALRKACDEAESITAEKYWPYPTYADLLFGVR